MDQRWLDLIFGGGAGVLITKLADWLLNSKKYYADVNKTTSAEWKNLYEEMKKVTHEQDIRIDKLEITCEELRLKNINLQQQISFGKELDKL